MDSAAYVLFAKENRYFTLSTGTSKLEELEEFPCHCPICCDYKPKEVLNFEGNLRTELLAKHNLYISFSELRTVRQAIREGNLWELVEQRVRNHPTLVDALNVVKSELPFLEKFEKIYKPHGRLYASPESVNRPMLHRYVTKLKNNYRVPQGVRYLILLPELDVKGYKSPTTKKWLEELDINKIISRKLLHIAFISEFYGIIPFELVSSFPMGQYESIDIIDGNLKQTLNMFLDLYGQNYNRCGVLIPEKYTNQFNEDTIYSKKDIYIDLFDELRSALSIDIRVFNNMPELLHFFKDE